MTLAWEECLEKAKDIHSSILPWRIAWTVQSIGEGNGNPLQYSCLENPMDGGAWLQKVGQDWVTFTFTLSSILAWRIYLGVYLPVKGRRRW